MKQIIRHYRRTLSFRFWVGGLGTVLIPAAGFPLAVCILDNLLGFPVIVRCILFSIWPLTITGLLIRAFLLFRKKRKSDRECALALERANNIRDNTLVNAVCFESDPAFPDVLRKVFVQKADQLASGMKFPEWAAGIRKILVADALLLILLILYGVAFPHHAGNAMQRFLNPFSRIASLNFIQFEIRPGNCILPKGSNLTIRAKAWKDGHSVSGLKLLIKGNAAPVLYPMADGAYTLRNIESSLNYCIQAGGETSENLKITVIQPPPVKQIQAWITPPFYTGIKAYAADLLKTPVITAPEKSKIRIMIHAANGSHPGFYRNAKKIPLPDDFILDREQMLTLSLTAEPYHFPNVWTGGITPKADHAPTVRFLNQKTNIEALYGEPILIEMSSTDDYGLAGLSLSGTVEKQTFLIRKYAYPVPGSKKVRELLPLKINPAMVPAGSVLELSLAATDHAGNTAKVPGHITIHPANPEALLRKSGQGFQSGECYEKLLRVIRIQKEAREQLAHFLKNMPHWALNQLIVRQTQVRNLLAEASSDAGRAHLPASLVRTLRMISTRYADPLLRNTLQLKKHYSKQSANGIILQQTKLIEALNKLVNTLALYEKREDQRKEKKAAADAEKELFDQMKLLKDKMDDFKRAQLRIKTDTENFDPKKTEDFTEAEEKLLGDLAARELDWAQFFKAAFSDLSKLQNQDFSNSAMADEFMELYEELQKAGSALKAKKIELATVAEANAASNADSIAANLERWLADKADYIKWNSEEDGKEKDTNLTDLPAELTDIIGDLIEQEGDEDEEQVQDSTNSFTWDTDDGLGWGVSDGTIDSMQAKGITGNVLPNQNEVGGRSGEGRSGRSSGQFVEKEATGKGGRKTPTRLVQSPYEKGTVTDKSKDAQGGATGGGKQSGTGGEGLSGVTPDQDPRIGERLAGNQGELRQRTNALLKALTDRNLPTGDIRDALAKLEKLEKLGSGSGTDIRRTRSEALRSLRQARTVLETAVAADMERKRAKRRETWSVKHNRTETVPAAYSDCVGEYFKALASEGERKE